MRKVRAQHGCTDGSMRDLVVLVREEPLTLSVGVSRVQVTNPPISGLSRKGAAPNTEEKHS